MALNSVYRAALGTVGDGPVGGGYHSDYHRYRGSYPALEFGDGSSGGSGYPVSAVETHAGTTGHPKPEFYFSHLSHDTVLGTSQPLASSSPNLSSYRQADTTIEARAPLPRYDSQISVSLEPAATTRGREVKARGMKRSHGDSVKGDEGSSNDEDHENERDMSIPQKSINPSRRAAQNRQAQKAFRQRREKYVKDLEDKALIFDQLQSELEEVKRENMELKKALQRQEELLAQTAHSASAPMKQSPTSTATDVSSELTMHGKRPSSELDEGSLEQSHGVEVAQDVRTPRSMSLEHHGPASLPIRNETNAFLRSIACSLSTPLGGIYPPDMVVTVYENWLRRSINTSRDATPRSTRASTPVLEWSRETILGTALEAVKIAADETGCSARHPMVDMQIVTSGGYRTRAHEIARQESFKVNEKCRSMVAQILNAMDRKLIPSRMFRLVWWLGIAAKSHAYVDIAVPRPGLSKTDIIESLPLQSDCFVMPAPPHCCCPNRNGRPLVRLGRSRVDNRTRRLPSIALAQYLPPSSARSAQNSTRLSPTTGETLHPPHVRSSSTSPLTRNARALGPSGPDISCDPGPYGTTEAELASHPPIGRPALRLDNICHPTPASSPYPPAIDYIEVVRDYLQFHHMALEVLDVQLQDELVPVFDESALLTDDEKRYTLFMLAEAAFADGRYDLAFDRYEILVNEACTMSDSDFGTLQLQLVRFKLMMAMCLMARDRDPRAILYDLLNDIIHGNIPMLSMHHSCKFPPPKLPAHQALDLSCRVKRFKHEMFVEYEAKSIPQFIVCLLTRYYRNLLDASQLPQGQGVLQGDQFAEYIVLCQLDFDPNDQHLSTILHHIQSSELKSAIPYIHDQDILAMMLSSCVDPAETRDAEPLATGSGQHLIDDSILQLAQTQLDQILVDSTERGQSRDSSSIRSTSGTSLSDRLFRKFVSDRKTCMNPIVEGDAARAEPLRRHESEDRSQWNGFIEASFRDDAASSESASILRDHSGLQIEGDDGPRSHKRPKLPLQTSMPPSNRRQGGLCAPYPSCIRTLSGRQSKRESGEPVPGYYM